MAEINMLSVFKNADGQPSFAEVDAHHALKLSADQPSNQVWTGIDLQVPELYSVKVFEYEVPTNRKLKLAGWEASASVAAMYSVYHNSTLISKKRTSAANPNVESNIPGSLELAQGDKLIIKAWHRERGVTASVFVSMYGKELVV